MYKICIADDEKYVQKSIAQRIESSGMEIEVAGTAGNGMEALLLYEKMRPDIFSWILICLLSMGWIS